MSAPIALQLYTVRDAVAKDFAGVVRKIADIGYVGVEPAGFPGTNARKAADLFRELGLAVPSAHTPLPLGEQQNQVLDAMDELGCTRIISGKGPDDFRTLDQIAQTCELFNQANAVALQRGLRFGIHNHWWEFLRVEGCLVYQVMLKHLEPEVFFEIDTYWAKTAGADPAQVLNELGSRAPLLHIKDGPAIRGEPQVAVGDGVMDVPALVAAGAKTTEWLIVELDQCATDMLAAVARSYAYLVGQGLASGRTG